MKIEADVLTPGQSTAKITHKDESVSFRISVYQKKSFMEDFEVFEYLNNYWADLPSNQQDELFAIYKDFNNIFNSFMQRDEIREALIEKTCELMSYHSLEVLDRWVMARSDIKVPNHVDSSYEEDINSNKTRAKTYIRSDYRELVIMSLALKCMLPIWGEEIHRIRRDIGNRFKEANAFELVSRTEIVQCTAFEKLSIYVDNIIEKDKDNASMIVEGISPESYGPLVVGMICVLRLPIGDIRGIDDPDRDLCKYIFKFITQKVRNNDSNSENGIRDKERESSSSGSENKTSSIERFKQTTDITVGEAEELQRSLEDPYKVVELLEPRVTQELLESSLESTRVLLGMKIAQPQIDLVCWIIKQITTPYAIDHIEDYTLVDLIAVTEAVLWARGHKFLALLVSAYPVTDDAFQVISASEGRQRIPQELIDNIEKYYPYSRTVSAKRILNREVSQDELDGRRQTVVKVNPVIESIEIMTGNLSYHSWRPTASSDKLKEVLGSNLRKLTLPSSIKVDLAKLCLEIGSRSYLD